MEVACAQKTLGRRRLVATHSRLESLDLETPLVGDNSSGRKLTFPSNQAGGIVSLLGSCNGLVCVEVAVVGDCEAWDVDPSTFYIWNPTTGLFQKLPDLVGEGSERYHGFGYLSATNEYKVVVIKNYNEVSVFSTRSHVWEIIKSPFHWEPLDRQGLLLNEALHWIPADYDYHNSVDYLEQSIKAFDLAKQEFMEKPLPTDILIHCRDSFDGIYLGSFEGCLCVCLYDYPCDCNDCIVLWVLREYDVCYSWTKLFKLRISDQPAQFTLLSIWRGRTFVAKLTDQRPGLMMIDHEEDQCCGPYMLGFTNIASSSVVEYEESLLWLEDYYDTGT